MQTTLPLETMTREDKLRAMETLWADLSRSDEQIESPAWHGDVLRERAEAVKSGREQFLTWEDAKRQLREKLK